MRDDIAHVQFAKYLGFRAMRIDSVYRGNRSPYNLGEPVPANALVFEKGDVHVWEVKGGWRFADYSGIKVTDHSPIFSDLSECLEAAAKYHLHTIHH